MGSKRTGTTMPRQERFEDFALLLREADDVAVIKRPVRAGTGLFNTSLRLVVSRDIPAGHKVAVKAGRGGAPIKKDGQGIGLAKSDINPGDYVHTPNLIVKDLSRDYDLFAGAKTVDYY